MKTKTPLLLNLNELIAIDSIPDCYNGRPAYKLLMGYLSAALWTNDDSAPSGDYIKTGRFAEMLPRFSQEALGRAFTDCKTFFVTNRANIEKSIRQNGNDWTQAGVDFWLTRNGHGSGYWEVQDWPEPFATTLTDAAHSFGETDLYEGDDKLLYFA